MPNFEEVAKQKVSACFRIKGKIVESPAEGQPVELLCDDPVNHLVEILGSNLDTGRYPLAKKAHSIEHLRSNLHLRPRSNLIGASMRVRNAISFATHLFFQSNGFLYVHTPIITGSDCEGAGEMFSVTTLLGDEPK
jgi:asparaginyl-tRNA synthetase